MRLFLALDLPAATKHRLADAVRSRREWWDGTDLARHVRLVPAANLHVTLKFLGEVPDDRVAAVRAALAAGVPRVGPVELRPASAGFFPPRGNARVFVVHLAGDLERLSTAYAGVESALESLGFPREGRPFKPHVTVGRARDRQGAPAAVRRVVERDAALAEEPFVVDAVTLFSSDLRPGGPAYSVVERFEL
ncbi:MAG TPA: RNA 2',3'-cyclic phosphodiesterase [Humisphaera sp.]